MKNAINDMPPTVGVLCPTLGGIFLRVERSIKLGLFVLLKYFFLHMIEQSSTIGRDYGATQVENDQTFL
jgi:hypothetical protein